MPPDADLAGLPMAAGFRYVEDIVAPGEPDSRVHVLNSEIQRLLAEAWVHYVDEVFDGDRTRAYAARPFVREVLTLFESECFPQDVLQCGVRAVSRSNTSLVLEESLWDAAEQRLVATARVVLVTVDADTRRPIAIDDAWWAAIAGYEGLSGT